MNQILPAPNSNEVEEQSMVYAKTDITALVDVIQSIAQDNKKGVDELIKLHRNMYNNIIQKQNDELEKYRQGAMRQSKLHVLRAVAEIYSDNNKDFEILDNPKFLLSEIMSLLEEVLEENDVQIIRSAPDELFDRKFMRTQERYVIPTNDQDKDRKIGESIKPGFTLYVEPLLQELVQVYKYSPPAPNPESLVPDASPESLTFENTGQSICPAANGDTVHLSDTGETTSELMLTVATDQSDCTPITDEESEEEKNA